jgi:hypothetical protein
MKATKLVLLTLFVFSTINISAEPRAQKRPVSPDALVADLYRQHNRKHSPFFQTRSRALVNRYFNKALADLIWKDATTKKEEVGALDGDPLYDAQDMQIKNFVVGKASIEEAIAQVPVSFENFDKKVQINFLLIKTPAGWRISDISYPAGYTLKSLLTSP